ncbi:MAG: TldD/PmbA family protein, partial [Acidobacteria bacterium]|nr:TldD/PmbA family protein [Acidobacteriota bacterium]
MINNSLEAIAVELVGRATRAGATAADVVVREADEFSTVVRLGKIESLKEAASKALGLRVFAGTRSATSFSSDFSSSSLGRLAERTFA